MRAVFLAAVLLLGLPLAGCVSDEGESPTNSTTEDLGPDDRWTAILETNMGTIEIEVFADLTPHTAQNFGELIEDGYYDGVWFHRIIDGFMIQGGDPQTKDTSKRDRWGTGGPGYTIRDEFRCQDGTLVTRHPGGYQFPADQCDDHGGLAVGHAGAGYLSMANTGRPNTGGSQFFITLDEQPRLDGYHPVFGRVTEGLDTVREIGKVPTNAQDQPTEPVFIEEASIRGELTGVAVTHY